jgi:hypothetical protein
LNQANQVIPITLPKNIESISCIITYAALQSTPKHNTLLNNQWVIEEIREEIKGILEFNENETITYQNLWDTAKAVLRGKFISMNVYIKNTERSQIKNLILHLKLLEKQG